MKNQEERDDGAKNIRRLIDAGKEVSKILSRPDFDYYIEKLIEREKVLFNYSKFKIGQYVSLNTTPEINENIRHGWIGYKNILVKGRIGKIIEVDYNSNRGGFCYAVMFNENGRDIGSFCFEEYLLSEEIPNCCSCNCHQKGGINA